MMIPKISIIIPVYNIEEYLPICLNSILGQDFNDFEIICINDCSNDGTQDLLQGFAAQDCRIKVITFNKNKGSGIARNTAINISRGKYILFIDGDDLLERQALAKMYAKAEKDNTDIVIFGSFSYYEKNIIRKKYAGSYSYKKIPHIYYNKVFSSSDIKKDLNKFPATAWTKLYRTEFIKNNNIRFQEIKIGQDQLFFFHSMITAQRISILKDNLYCYRKNRKGSAMSVKKKSGFSPINVYYAIENLLIRKHLIDDYYQVFIYKYFSKAASWLGKLSTKHKNMYFKKFTELHTHICMFYRDGWWIYFTPEKNDNLIKIKVKIFIAKIKFIITKIVNKKYIFKRCINSF